MIVSLPICFSGFILCDFSSASFLAMNSSSSFSAAAAAASSWLSERMFLGKGSSRASTPCCPCGSASALATSCRLRFGGFSSSLSSSPRSPPASAGRLFFDGGGGSSKEAGSWSVCDDRCLRRQKNEARLGGTYQFVGASSSWHSPHRARRRRGPHHPLPSVVWPASWCLVPCPSFRHAP
jgi:hypothetical protein